ncbi:hypothetical protein KsCSTR_05410 [Candidatus Kuenenia stuttgartiensis]|jgi:hypothetical protein|uniref:Cytochrome c n=1 Tax=Kuenenia stuttgartiensis TaxID=174633 RepID=Q1Q048_KUEST|nr:MULTISPECIES: cytochrome c [Kuenenia]MBE7546541.1 cytochrome c [Planctomycetia bacterium]MBZ0190871.1 cytochrome c [Candidatus Kuenenia stuttgartiensis]MCF6151450.1 hypothetical protein [Candidatus Kuenenia stuttgartiensis]MCL4726203.1 cytochrome c [Candidatus Kuenenia stuttgartiensis]MCZ7621828.1 cytochrome c [Candidatus Kuenenia sp.]
MKYHALFFCLLTVGVVVNVPVNSKVIMAQGKAMEHEEVIAPTKELMKEIENRLNNMLSGILENNLKYVANEAGAIVDKSYKINQIFFDFNRKGNDWFKRAGIDPADTGEIAKREEEFTLYQSGIVYKALNVRKMAMSGNQEETLRAFTDMIETTCFACHRKNRDWLLDQPGSHGPGR